MDSEINFVDFVNDVVEEEQILLDKPETDLNVDLKMPGYKNDMEKYEILDIPVKLVNILLSERDTSLTLDFQKSPVKLLKDFVRGDKKRMKTSSRSIFEEIKVQDC
uniref:Uncharacterized protein n=1 Tax=Micrurus spixii TaxID=129469 RepID=A0A2D4LBJ3_9SAUR